MAYLPCELNCHTKNSDGNLETKELLKLLADDHLALIAITDNATTDAYDELDDSITPAIKGVEWNTPTGVIRILGANESIDFSNVNKDNLNELISCAKAAGGIIGVSPKLESDTTLINWRNIDYLEVWQGAFSFDNKIDEKSIALWNDLLDKGYHIACTYGRSWGNEQGHQGCSYVDIEGDVCQASAIRGIRMGKTVASTGAKLFFRVHQKGKTYNMGETVKKGNAVFSFFTDLHSRSKDEGDEEILYKTIKLITNGGKCVMESSLSERHIAVTLKKNQWYRAELWGSVNGVDKLLAVTSPIYTA